MTRANIYDDLWGCQEANRARHFPRLREVHFAHRHDDAPRLPAAPTSLVEALARAILGGGVVMLCGVSVGRYKTACEPACFAVINTQGEVLRSWTCPFDAALWVAKQPAHNGDAEQWLVSQGLLEARRNYTHDAFLAVLAAVRAGNLDDLAATILDHFPDAPLSAQVLGRLLPYYSAAHLAAVGGYGLSDLHVGRAKLNPAPKMPELWGIVWTDHAQHAVTDTPENLAWALCWELVTVQDHALSMGQMQPHNAKTHTRKP
jgi:hypothetical protein